MNLPITLLKYLAGVGSIVLMMGVLAGGFAGIGLAIRRSLGLRAVTVDDCFLAFWVGFGVVIPFLIVWNFFLPVTGYSLTVVLLMGGLGLFLSRRELPRVFDHTGWRPSTPVWFLLIVAALWIANLSLGPLNNYDSALYHLQGLLWAKSYPAVPGLANLYGPLGFNNSSLLYDAMLDSGFWTGRGNHLANGLLVLMVLLQVIVAGARFASSQDSEKARQLFVFMLLAMVITVGMNDRISSLVTDLPVSMMLLVAASRLYAGLTTPHHGPEEEAFGLVSLAILLASAVAIKMNAVFFAIPAIVIALVIWIRRSIAGGYPFRKLLFVTLLIPAMVGAAWMGRGIVLSGYPAFPSPILAAPVDWRAPEAHAQAEFDYIVHSGRETARNVPVIMGEAGMEGWLSHWAEGLLEDPFYVLVPTFLLVVGAVTWIVTRKRVSPEERASIRPGWLLFPTLLLAVVAWFFGAPSARYIAPVFWLMVALVWAQVYRLRASASETQPPRNWMLLWLTIGLAPLVINPILYARQDYKNMSPVYAILRYNLKRPGTDLWFQPVEDHPETRPYVTQSGLVVNVPVSPTGRCWGTPLPCTPNPAPNLQLRDVGHIDHGFKVTGDWQMESWPYPRQPIFLPAWRRARERAN